MKQTIVIITILSTWTSDIFQMTAFNEIPINSAKKCLALCAKTVSLVLCVWLHNAKKQKNIECPKDDNRDGKRTKLHEQLKVLALLSLEETERSPYCYLQFSYERKWRGSC